MHYDISYPRNYEFRLINGTSIISFQNNNNYTMYSIDLANNYIYMVKFYNRLYSNGLSFCYEDKSFKNKTCSGVFGRTLGNETLFSFEEINSDFKKFYLLGFNGKSGTNPDDIKVVYG